MTSAFELEAARVAWVLLAEPEPPSDTGVGVVCTLRAIVGSTTFAARALWSLREGDLKGRFLGERVTVDLAVWAATTFPLSVEGRERVERARSRGELLRVVLADTGFRFAVPEAGGAATDAALKGADQRAPMPVEAIALLCAARDPAPEKLDAFARSVLAQDLDDWELCVCDHGSSTRSSRYALERLRGTDARVRICVVGADATEAQAIAAAALRVQAPYAWWLASVAPLRPDALRKARAAGAASPLVRRAELLNPC